MIRNTDKLRKFYEKLIENEDISHKKALSIYEAMHKEAIALGTISHENIWDGFDAVLRIAKAINGLNCDRKTNKKPAHSLD